MERTEYFQMRVTPEERGEMDRAMDCGPWKSVADMIRDLVKEVAAKQSQEPPQETEQHQPDHHGDEPQL